MNADVRGKKFNATIRSSLFSSRVCFLQIPLTDSQTLSAALTCEDLLLDVDTDKLVFLPETLDGVRADLS